MKIAVTAGLALCLALGRPVLAQPAVNGVRVMIAADDADSQSVIRSSNMYHRIQLPLNEEMKRSGYIALFEDAMAAELTWEVQDRSSKQKSISLAKTACTSNKATLCPRVIVLVRTMAMATELGFGMKVKVVMTGELIDVSTNAMLGGWEAPPLEFPAPKGCNDVCIQDVVGENARKVALNLSDTLRRVLDQQALSKTSSTANRGAVTGGRPSGGGLVNSFVIGFEHFDMTEILPLQEIMEKEFTDTVEVTTPSGGSGSFSINLVTRQKASQILGLLHLMMEDRGYNMNNIKVSTAGDKFVIDRIVDDQFRPGARRRNR